MTSGIQVWFDDLKQTKAITSQLTTLFKEKGIDRYFNITSFYEYDFAKDLIQQFRSDKYLFTLIGIIILIVACSNIISFLVLMVNDKKKEIGILQSMGASSTSIAGIFALCGITLGILGSVLGSIAAFFTMQHIDSLVGLLSFLQGHDALHESFYGNSLPTTLSSQAVLFVAISTPILSVFAGLVPAIKACRLKPAETLRSQ
jgi:lipoprotein-releasing system permease protein